MTDIPLTDIYKPIDALSDKLNPIPLILTDRKEGITVTEKKKKTHTVNNDDLQQSQNMMTHFRYRFHNSVGLFVST